MATICARSFRRFSRSVLVVGVDGDLVEEAIDGRAEFRHLAHGAGEIFAVEQLRDGLLGGQQRVVQRFLLGLRQRGCVGCVAILALVLLLLDLEDVRRAAIAGEQVRAVVGFEECLQRFDAAHEADQIVFVAEREHGIDQIVANAFFPQRDFQAVGKEYEGGR